MLVRKTAAKSALVKRNKGQKVTSRDAVDIMLDKEMNHRHKGTKERIREPASQLLSTRVLGCALHGPNDMRDRAE